MARTQKPLWTCPKCKHRLVTRNMSHSCSNYSLASHFKGKDPSVRQVFDAFLAVVEQNGPVTVIPQKTRIAIQVRVRFAGGVARKSWFDAGLWLTRRAAHPRLRRVETYGPRTFVLRFRLTRPEDIDAKLAALVRESYAVGCQKHLEQRERRGPRR